MLKITGSNYTNTTNITCHVTQFREGRFTTDESKPALILVQGIRYISYLVLLIVGHHVYISLGLLDPVTNLAVTINGDKAASTNITWSPPYTLVNVPILAYTVDIDSCLTRNVTNPYLEYQANLDIFDVQIAVRSVNKAGKGRIAATTTVIPVMSCVQGILKQQHAC